mmetsp:Transcript_52618/g.61422  ORF Transcript_52618/g.61422 Transcript_52618/m.61422 type:complete len:352 (+) Transcript_52618:132-1187(+)
MDFFSCCKNNERVDESFNSMAQHCYNWNLLITEEREIHHFLTQQQLLPQFQQEFQPNCDEIQPNCDEFQHDQSVAYHYDDVGDCDYENEHIYKQDRSINPSITKEKFSIGVRCGFEDKIVETDESSIGNESNNLCSNKKKSFYKSLLPQFLSLIPSDFDSCIKPHSYKIDDGSENDFIKNDALRLKEEVEHSDIHQGKLSYQENSQKDENMRQRSLVPDLPLETMEPVPLSRQQQVENQGKYLSPSLRPYSSMERRMYQMYEKKHARFPANVEPIKRVTFHPDVCVVEYFQEDQDGERGYHQQNEAASSWFTPNEIDSFRREALDEKRKHETHIRRNKFHRRKRNAIFPHE